MEIRCKVGSHPGWTYRDKAIHMDGLCYQLSECELVEFSSNWEGERIVLSYRGNKLELFYAPSPANVLEQIEMYAAMSDEYKQQKEDDRKQKKLAALKSTLLKLGLVVLIGFVAVSIFGGYEAKMFALKALLVFFGLVLVVIVGVCIVQGIRNRETAAERERMRQAKIKAEANKRIQDLRDGKPDPDLVKLQQKSQQKKETKQIIKGAVAGGIIAGEAGAVVGAVIAKNKIDSEKKQQ